MTNLLDNNIYNRIGEAGFARLVAAFYALVPDDEILGPMYPQDDWPGAEQRLRDFLVMRFGGPPRYLEQRGHPALRARHAKFPIDQAASDRWVELMERALSEAEIPHDAAAVLRAFFHNAATFLINRPGG